MRTSSTSIPSGRRKGSRSFSPAPASTGRGSRQEREGAGAGAVLDLSRWPEAPWAMDAVQSLLDQSLLRIEGTAAAGGAGEEPRFGMLASLQEYAREKLPDAERRAAEARHGAFYARFGTE